MRLGFVFFLILFSFSHCIGQSTNTDKKLTVSEYLALPLGQQWGVLDRQATKVAQNRAERLAKTSNPELLRARLNCMQGLYLDPDKPNDIPAGVLVTRQALQKPGVSRDSDFAVEGARFLKEFCDSKTKDWLNKKDDKYQVAYFRLMATYEQQSYEDDQTRKALDKRNKALEAQMLDEWNRAIVLRDGRHIYVGAKRGEFWVVSDPGPKGKTELLTDPVAIAEAQAILDSRK